MPYACVNSSNIREVLESERVVSHYPQPLVKEAVVIINGDDYLPVGEWRLVQVRGKEPILPHKIILYGKKDGYSDTLYLNYWVPVFIGTIEKGFIEYYAPETLDTNALCVGLSIGFRKEYIHCDVQATKDFIVALFGGRRKVKIEE